MWARSHYCGEQINDTWQAWIFQLIKVTEKFESEPHNFGDYYYFYVFSSGETIDFPKDQYTRKSIIGNRFHTGRLLGIMPKAD